MKILEKDFKIEVDEDKCVLYTLKSKKELAENSEDKYKIAGYSFRIQDAIWQAIKFRENKKYPFKESANPLRKLWKEHRTTLYKVTNLLETINIPIYTLKEKILNGYRWF